MSFSKVESELHQKRKVSNWIIFVCLIALMTVFVTLSLTKLLDTGPQEGWDHAVQTSRIPE